MFNTLLQFLLNIILTVIKVVLDVILLPITLLIKGLFPGVGDYIHYFYELLDQHLFNGLRFAREVILNLSGLNRNLLGIAALIPLTYLTFSIMNASVRFIVSIYRIWKTGKDE